MNNTTTALKEQVKSIESKIAETQALIDSNELDEMMLSLAKEDLEKLQNQKIDLVSVIEAMEKGYQPKSSSDDSAATTGDAIMEIRAGAGGDEAGLFASQLFNMYSKFAEKNGWTTSVISKNEGGIGNIKEVSFEIKAKGNADSPTPYDLLQHESGVHRVQRVPVTESGGRIHTSTVTVAVLPIIGEVELQIKPEDLKIDTYRAGGAGGQHVNKTESAIRITHIPTGVVVQCQDERSQHKNKERAMSLLRSKLYEAMQMQQKNSLDELRSVQVGTGERNEKIRTYNFPQDRITDHRVKQSWHNIERKMLGEIGEMLEDVSAGITEEQS